jgi:hypothetical protein
MFGLRMGLGLGARQSASGASAEAQAYIQRVEADGGYVVDQSYCNLLVQFLQGIPVIIGETTYTLSASIWDDLNIVVSIKGGIKTDTVEGTTYLTKMYNMKMGDNVDFAQPAANLQPVMDNGRALYTKKELSHEGSLLSMVSDKAEVFAILVKEWKAAGGGDNIPMGFRNSAAEAPRFTMLSGEATDRLLRNSIKRTGNTWVSAVSSAAADVDTRSVYAIHTRYNLGKASLWINNVAPTINASYSTLQTPGTNSSNTASTSLTIGYSIRNSGYLDLLIAGSNQNVSDYTNRITEIKNFIVALEGIA